MVKTCSANTTLLHHSKCQTVGLSQMPKCHYPKCQMPHCCTTPNATLLHATLLKCHSSITNAALPVYLQMPPSPMPHYLFKHHQCHIYLCTFKRHPDIKHHQCCITYVPSNATLISASPMLQSTPRSTNFGTLAPGTPSFFTSSSQSQ